MRPRYICSLPVDTVPLDSSIGWDLWNSTSSTSNKNRLPGPSTVPGTLWTPLRRGRRNNFHCGPTYHPLEAPSWNAAVLAARRCSPHGTWYPMEQISVQPSTQICSGASCRGSHATELNELIKLWAELARKNGFIKSPSPKLIYPTLIHVSKSGIPEFLKGDLGNQWYTNHKGDNEQPGVRQTNHKHPQTNCW